MKVSVPVGLRSYSSQSAPLLLVQLSFLRQFEIETMTDLHPGAEDETSIFKL